MPERKTIKVQLKADDEGAVVALFSTYGVIDHDSDVVLPGAFKAGQEVPIGSWGHDTRALPVGKGVIVDGSDGARIDGRLFLDSSGGRDTFATLKGLGDVAEWSYVYNPVEAERGRQDDQDVRFLKQIDVFSVDPVLRGAGIGTRTELVKALVSAVPSLKLTFADQAEHTLAVVLALNHRAAELAALRGKDGRSLSAANRERFQELLAGMEEAARKVKALLRETDPDKTAAEALALYARFQRIRNAI